MLIKNNEANLKHMTLRPGGFFTLHPGLNVLTGETGAGKTMLVEAISLLVGGRADSMMVRPGAAEARAEGLRVSSAPEASARNSRCRARRPAFDI